MSGNLTPLQHWGYSDKQAVAVGVGYRFNEQTAAKAGVATSDGDVSYNVGVNFEF